MAARIGEKRFTIRKAVAVYIQQYVEFPVFAIQKQPQFMVDIQGGYVAYPVIFLMVSEPGMASFSPA
jgi:hypothetical protein